MQKLGDQESSRGRWSEARGRAVVAEWQASGLSRSEFCRSRGISQHRLRYWAERAEAGRQPVDGAAVRGKEAFFALSVSEPERTSKRRSAEGLAEVVRGGVELRVHGRYVVHLDPELGHDRFVQSLRWVLEALES